MSLLRLLSIVAAAWDVRPALLRRPCGRGRASPGPHTRLRQARFAAAALAVEELGASGPAVAEVLGCTQAAVSWMRKEAPGRLRGAEDARRLAVVLARLGRSEGA